VEQKVENPDDICIAETFFILHFLITFFFILRQKVVSDIFTLLIQLRKSLAMLFPKGVSAANLKLERRLIKQILLVIHPSEQA